MEQAADSFPSVWDTKKYGSLSSLTQPVPGLKSATDLCALCGMPSCAGGRSGRSRLSLAPFSPRSLSISFLRLSRSSSFLFRSASAVCEIRSNPTHHHPNNKMHSCHL